MRRQVSLFSGCGNMKLSVFDAEPERQMDLFPRPMHWLEDAFCVVDQPCAALACAFLVPQFNACNGAELGSEVLCLAVTADRQFAARVSLEITLPDLIDSNRIWHRLAGAVESTRQRYEGLTNEWLTQIPHDCYANWTNVLSWFPYSAADTLHPVAKEFAMQSVVDDSFSAQQLMDTEAQFQSDLEERIATGTAKVISTMEPEIASLLALRPSMPMRTIDQLRRRSRSSGRNDSMRFIMQALRTESIALLDLAASASGQPAGARIFETIVSGESLPKALTCLGIARAAHRRTIRAFSEDPSKEAVKKGLSDIPLSGKNWLWVMSVASRLQFDLWPHKEAHWYEFFFVAMTLEGMQLTDTFLNQLLQWCAARDFADSSFRLALLLQKAQAIATATKNLAHLELSSECVLSHALNLTPIDPRRGDPLRQIGNRVDCDEVGKTVRTISRFSGISTELLTMRVFKIHPGPTAGIRCSSGLAVQPLRSLHEVIEQGRKMGTCLADEERAIQYAANGIAMYAIRSDNGNPLGTVALGFERGRGAEKVIIWQTTGNANTPATPRLMNAARQLVKWFTTNSLEIWHTYLDHAEAFRHAAGAS